MRKKIEVRKRKKVQNPSVAVASQIVAAKARDLASGFAEINRVSADVTATSDDLAGVLGKAFAEQEMKRKELESLVFFVNNFGSEVTSNCFGIIDKYRKALLGEGPDLTPDEVVVLEAEVGRVMAVVKGGEPRRVDTKAKFDHLEAAKHAMKMPINLDVDSL